MEKFLFESDKIAFQYLGGDEVAVEHENGLSFCLNKVDILRENRLTYEIHQSIITCGFDGDKEPYFDAKIEVDKNFDSYLWDFLVGTSIYERWQDEINERENPNDEYDPNKWMY